MKKSVVLGVTGSIAAYKAADVVRLLRREGVDVWVVMTEGACRFIGELTFRTLSRNPVACAMFDPPETWVPRHIALADRAAVFAVAPCTANVLAKLAHGIADDLLSCTALAVCGPLVIAPAMNDRMLDHPATRANIVTLRERGATVLDTDEGDLACGYVAKGRMAEPECVVRAILEKLA